MRRREFITVTDGLAITWPIAVRAQQRERMRRAELRRHSQSGEYQARKTAFLQLAQLGWIDGRNVRIDTRGALPMSTEFVKYATEMLGPCESTQDSVRRSGTEGMGGYGVQSEVVGRSPRCARGRGCRNARRANHQGGREYGVGHTSGASAQALRRAFGRGDGRSDGLSALWRRYMCHWWSQTWHRPARLIAQADQQGSTRAPVRTL